MKHISTMLLALGLASLSAAGQNVTVIMKDGTSHKFNADYLSELSFKDVPSGPETVEFKSIEVEPYSNGNVTLTFTNEEGNIELVTDLYGPKETVWLRPGVYTLSGTGDPWTMHPGWSFLKIDGDKKEITGGTVEVTLEGKVFSFAMDLALADGSSFKGSYSGELDTYTQWLVKELSAAKYNENPQPSGNFYVKFNDQDWTCEMAVVFTGDAGDTELQPGVYTYSDARLPGTISPASSVSLYNPYANLRLLSGSKVTVEKNDGNYTMKMDLLFDDGRTGDFSFNGEITGTPSFDQQEPEAEVFPVLNVNPYGNGNTTLYFYTEDNSRMFSLDCYGSYDATFFETGVYTIGGDVAPYIDTTYINYTFYLMPNEADPDNPLTLPLESGTLTVTREGPVYTFVLDAILGDDAHTPIKMTHTGPLDNFGPEVTMVLNDAEYDTNPRPAGNLYVKFSNRNCEMALDIYADASATRLPAGTYTYSADKTPGTFSPISYVDLYSPYSNNRMKEGSTVTVEVDEYGYNYSVTMHLLFEDGREANMTYEGPISETPVFE